MKIGSKVIRIANDYMDCIEGNTYTIKEILNNGNEDSDITLEEIRGEYSMQNFKEVIITTKWYIKGGTIEMKRFLKKVGSHLDGNIDYGGYYLNEEGYWDWDNNNYLKTNGYTPITIDEYELMYAPSIPTNWCIRGSFILYCHILKTQGLPYGSQFGTNTSMVYWLRPDTNEWKSANYKQTERTEITIEDYLIKTNQLTLTLNQNENRKQNTTEVQGHSNTIGRTTESGGIRVQSRDCRISFGHGYNGTEVSVKQVKTKIV